MIIAKLATRIKAIIKSDYLTSRRLKRGID